MYQIAQSGILRPRIYALHLSSDGSPASPTLLDADFEVYTCYSANEGVFTFLKLGEGNAVEVIRAEAKVNRAVP